MVTYPSDWKTNKIIEVADIFDNLRIPVTKNQRKPGNTPYYGANGIQDYVSGYTHDGEFVLIAEDGANDLQNYPVTYASGKIWVNNHAHVLAGVNSKADTRFLAYLLKKVDFAAVLVGGTRAKLNGKTLKNIEVTLPERLKEQQAIASALSDFDEHIDNLTELIEKKKAIRDGALEDLVSGRTRLDGFNGEWIESTIEDSTKEIITGGTPSTTVDKYWGGSIPWLASTEIHQKIITRATKNITNIGLNNSSAKMAPKDSVLIALAGQGKTRGTAAFLAYPMALNQSLAALVAADETDSKFLYYLIENMYLELRELSSGDGGRGGLNKTLIKNINIRLPREIKEQHAIAEGLTAMDEEIEYLKIEKEKMIQIKEGAMDDLLTGRVRLKV
jgi:type I restriction enzyme S subunit